MTATLIGTFLALVVATFWVPSRAIGLFAPGGVHWRWVGAVDLGLSPQWPQGPLEDFRWFRVDGWLWLLQAAVVIAFGGLLALYFRTRRGAA